MKKILLLGLALLLTLPILTGKVAAEGLCLEVSSPYYFRATDLGGEDLTGICITEVPDGVMLKNRKICRVDILTDSQMERLCYNPGGESREETFSYLPICGKHVKPEMVCTLSIIKKENAAPTAETMELESYKNLKVTGQLKP